jgi:hypothetical protein
MNPPDTDPAHEVECPQCGATIRARMADRDFLAGPYSTLAELLDRLVAERGSWDNVTADDLAQVQHKLTQESTS